MTAQWMDDGAVLAAALAFVDECESSLAAAAELDDALLPTPWIASAAQDELAADECTALEELLGPDATRHAGDANAGPPQLPALSLCAERTSPSVKKPRSDPNKSRNERKQELIYFRNQVAELEARLRDMLRHKRPRKSFALSLATGQARAAEGRNDQELPGHSTAVRLWKEIANSQSSARARSERENIRLKLVLENQLRIANNLQKFLDKSTATRDIEKCVYRSNGMHVVGPPTADWTDNQVFESLFAGVHATYSEIDALLAAISLARSETPHVAAKMLTDESKDMFMEMFGNKAFPFDVETTAKAVWDHFVSMKERIPYRHYYHTAPKKVNAEGDTIVENCILEMQLNQTTVRFRLKQILRRYVERGRVIVVWRGCFSPIELSGELIPGMQFMEKGFIVVKRPKMDCGNMSLLQTCYITKPELTGTKEEVESPATVALLDFVLTTTAGNITASHQMIENALLEQMLQKSHRVS